MLCALIDNPPTKRVLIQSLKMNNHIAHDEVCIYRLQLWVLVKAEAKVQNQTDCLY